MTDLSKLSSKELEALLAQKKEEERREALDKRAGRVCRSAGTVQVLPERSIGFPRDHAGVRTVETGR